MRIHQSKNICRSSTSLCRLALLNMAIAVSLTGCASIPVQKGGTLTSYDGMAAAKGRQTRAQLKVDPDRVLAARTVRIAPTRFADGADTKLSDKDRALVSNRIDRALCRSLARRLEVVGPGEPADLTVQATVTRLGRTDKIAAGAAVVASFVSVVPLVSPRLPVGLGSLAIEAEAVDQYGNQQAAMLWARKAQPVGLFTNATISRIGDAYQLSSSFGSSFGDMIATGQSPFGKGVKLPKMGGRKDEDCEVFGKDSGVIGIVADNFGAPPSWTDKGKRKPRSKAIEPVPESDN